MRLHLVNGFLGSGKTTAIIAATRHSLKQGKKVAIVTNDKGRYQVDAAFFESAHIPTAQVAGGCFRCSFDEFQEQISSLFHAAHPDILFAESVGSCVDLVNTVFPPLRSVPGIQLEASTFSVFTDIRLFRRWLDGQPLPFSDSIVYTYGKQIDETRLLVLNKMDLIDPQERSRLLAEAQQRLPGKQILLQNSLAEGDYLPWLEYLDTEGSVPLAPEFQVDYTQYMDAEKKMAWYDQSLVIDDSTPAHGIQGALAFISNLIQSLREQAIPTAHIKFHINGANGAHKLSFTALDFQPGGPVDNWQTGLTAELAGPIQMVINARVETKSYLFRELVERAIRSACETEKVTIQRMGGSSYHPRVLPLRP